MIISCGSDECSEAKLNDLLSLNIIMGHIAKNFKTACIQYECKQDKDLENELSKVILSCQMADSEITEDNEENQTDKIQAVNTSVDSSENDDRSIYIKAKSSNIF